jgi:hypothetical protein
LESPPLQARENVRIAIRLLTIIARAMVLASASVLHGSFIVRVSPPPFSNSDAGRSKY